MQEQTQYPDISKKLIEDTFDKLTLLIKGCTLQIYALEGVGWGQQVLYTLHTYLCTTSRSNMLS